MTSLVSALKRISLSELYNSDFAYWAGLLVLWEVIGILIALWVVPALLDTMSAAGPILVPAVVGAGA